MNVKPDSACQYEEDNPGNQEQVPEEVVLNLV